MQKLLTENLQSVALSFAEKMSVSNVEDHNYGSVAS